MFSKRYLSVLPAVLVVVLLFYLESPREKGEEQSAVESTAVALNPRPPIANGRRQTRASQDHGERATPLQWAARRVQAPPALCLIQGSGSSVFEFSRDHLPASVVLEKAPVLSGQVVDSGGRPLEGGF